MRAYETGEERRGTRCQECTCSWPKKPRKHAMHAPGSAHAPTRARTHAHTHARTRTRTRTHTHTHKHPEPPKRTATCWNQNTRNPWRAKACCRTTRSGSCAPPAPVLPLCSCASPVVHLPCGCLAPAAAFFLAAFFGGRGLGTLALGPRSDGPVRGQGVRVSHLSLPNPSLVFFSRARSLPLYARTHPLMITSPSDDPASEDTRVGVAAVHCVTHAHWATCKRRATSLQEMRLPAGLGLELLLANSRAERGVCEMPPQDPACIAARREEEEAVKVLHAELHAAVSTVIDEQHGLVGNLLQPSAALRQHVALVRKLAALIHSQKAPDQLSQEGWRTLNAVSAVVLKQTLARVEADAATSFHDVLLHHDSPHILYIGAFKGLRFDGLGCLYRTDGSLAYSGGFRDGLMHGQGTLLDHQGAVLWKGHFYDGSPARPWYSL